MVPALSPRPSTPSQTPAPTPFGTDARTRQYVLGFTGLEVFGTLARFEATEKTTAAMPCFSGFQLPVCTQGEGTRRGRLEREQLKRGQLVSRATMAERATAALIDVTAPGSWINNSGWHAEMPPNYSLGARGHPFCLQCCSARGDWFDSRRDVWSMRCRKGTVAITVIPGAVAGGEMTAINPWSELPERIPLARCQASVLMQ